MSTHLLALIEPRYCSTTDALPLNPLKQIPVGNKSSGNAMKWRPRDVFFRFLKLDGVRWLF